MVVMHSYFLSMLLIAASIGVASGICGAVYVLILTEPDMILGGFKRVVVNAVQDLFKKLYKEPYKADSASDYWLKPIITCELCVSGQIALWTYVITQPFHIFGLIYSICQAILTAWLIARIMKLLTQS